MARHGRRGGGGEGEGAERSYRDLSWVCNTIESHSNYILYYIGKVQWERKLLNFLGSV